MLLILKGSEVRNLKLFTISLSFTPDIFELCGNLQVHTYLEGCGDGVPYILEEVGILTHTVLQRGQIDWDSSLIVPGFLEGFSKLRLSQSHPDGEERKDKPENLAFLPAQPSTNTISSPPTPSLLLIIPLWRIIQSNRT